MLAESASTRKQHAGMIGNLISRPAHDLIRANLTDRPSPQNTLNYVSKVLIKTDGEAQLITGRLSPELT